MGQQMSTWDAGRRGTYIHDTQYSRLSKCDLIGKCDPADGGKGVRIIRT